MNEEVNFNPTAEEVIAELTAHPDGKVQLEMAVLRAVVARQKAYIDSTRTTEDEEKSP